MTALWQVALADDYLDKYEESIIRKISDLIHLRHSEYIQCKANAITKINSRQHIHQKPFLPKIIELYISFCQIKFDGYYHEYLNDEKYNQKIREKGNRYRQYYVSDLYVWNRNYFCSC
mgnify:CR=1 FL=1